MNVPSARCCVGSGDLHSRGRRTCTPRAVGAGAGHRPSTLATIPRPAANRTAARAGSRQSRLLARCGRPPRAAGRECDHHRWLRHDRAVRRRSRRSDAIGFIVWRSTRSIDAPEGDAAPVIVTAPTAGLCCRPVVPPVSSIENREKPPAGQSGRQDRVRSPHEGRAAASLALRVLVGRKTRSCADESP